MAAIDAALPKLAWLEIAERGKSSPIKLTDLDAAPEPRNLRRLKAEVRSRWGTVPLIDMLKEVVLRTGCLSAVTAAAGRGDLAPDVFAERLLLTIYAYSTNTGIRAIAGSAQHGHGEDDIRYVRRRYLTADVARTIAVEIANATFAARAQTVWVPAPPQWPATRPTSARSAAGARRRASYGVRMLMPIMRAPVSVRGRCVLPGANTT